MAFSRQEYRSGLHLFLPGIIPTQGSNPCLLHWQAGSLTLNYLGSPGYTFVFIKLHFLLPSFFLLFILSFINSCKIKVFPFSHKRVLYLNFHFSSVAQSGPTPWNLMDCSTPGSLSFTISQRLLKLKLVRWSVMPSNHLILCRPLLLLPSTFPSIRIFSNESTLRIRWPKYWSFSFNISPSNEYLELISFRMDWLDLLAIQGTLKSLLQHHSSKASILWHSGFFMAKLSHAYVITGEKKHSFD